MKITHKMTMADKIKEILQINGWKQKELAKQLGVSEKTVSLWVNNKKRPSEKKQQKINQIYHDLTANNTSIPHNEIIELQSKKGLDEFEKVLTDNEKEYYAAKCYVLAKEKDNQRFIYLFPSLGKEIDGWYKVGGKSLLFYKNILAPRLGRDAKLRDDTDRIYRFGDGIASARWGDKLIEESRILGYDARRIEYRIIVVDLGKDYGESEIKKMARVIHEERWRVRKIIKPKNNYPNLMMEINKLVRVLPSKVKKLDVSYRNVWGKELLEPMAELVKIYYRFANGRMEKKDARFEMLERIDDLAAMIYMMDECGMLDITARARLGENVVCIRQEIEKNL